MTLPFRPIRRRGRIALEYRDPALNRGWERPDGRSMLTELSVLPGWTDGHDVRLRGVLHAPADGDYVLTTPGGVEVLLGESEALSSARRVVAPDQERSAPVTLQAGSCYYLEARRDAGGRDTVLRVGWEGPEGLEAKAIPGEVLEPYNPLEDLPPAHELFAGLSRRHPRLLLSAYDVAVLRARIADGGNAARLYEGLRERAEQMLAAPLPEYTPTDPYAANLEGVGNQLIERMESLGFVHQIELVDGDRGLAERCAERAWQELEAASHFEHWDTEHFAGVPRMAHAYGMGYDWFYEALGPDRRAVVRRALVELGIKAYQAELSSGPFGWHEWTVRKGNWNCTINGDMGVALLAVAEEGDYLCEEVFERLLTNVQNQSLLTFYPDGGTKESPSYWRYKEQYFLPLFPALESALGTDMGLLSAPGLREAPLLPLHAMGPSGQFFDYSDGNTGWQATPGLLWLARVFDRPLYAWLYRERFADDVSVRALLWADDRGGPDALAEVPPDAWFRNAEVAFLRGAWNDAGASWAGFACTDNDDFIHGQLDQGTFVFDALGQRWASDFGADNYGLPGYWDKATGGVRWKAYRIRAEGHNTLVVNPGVTHEDQHPMARGSIVAFGTEGDDPFAVGDLTEAYRPHGARSARRGVRLLGRRVLLVVDELRLDAAGEVWWFLHTRADIAVAEDGRSARLTQGGTAATVHIVEGPQGAALQEMEAERLPESPGATPGERGAEGCRKVAIRLGSVTQMRLAVALVPEGSDVPTGPVPPLATWDDGGGA